MLPVDKWYLVERRIPFLSVMEEIFYKLNISDKNDINVMSPYTYNGASYIALMPHNQVCADAIVFLADAFELQYSIVDSLS